jgi:hypothetical protein
VVTTTSLATSRPTIVTPSTGATFEALRLVPTTTKLLSTNAAAVAAPMPEDAPVARQPNECS